MYIKVRVTAGAKKEMVQKISDTHFKISVREKAENNLANKRVLAIIASRYAVSIGKVRIISGHHSPSKILSVAVEDKI